MPVRLSDAMREVLDGWAGDLAPAWAAVAADVELGFADMDADLSIEPWEPIFPARRGRVFPGAPAGAHMLRAFDGIAPPGVRCVILGQDPYPDPNFSTGRAFEAGNVAAWRELDKMFSKSVRAFTQMIVEARTGDARYGGAFANWPRTLAAIEDGAAALEPASGLAQRWVDQGVLLLNSSLTLSRFKVEIDPHQRSGHLPLWRPLVLAVLRALGPRTVFVAFGEVAVDTLQRAGIEGAIEREHPARADAVLAKENPFLLCNRRLEAMGVAPIGW